MKRTQLGTVVLAAAVTASLGLGGCGGGATTSTAPTPTPTRSSPGTPATSRTPHPTQPPATHPTEFSPPGDIPDNQVFVDYRVPGSRVHISVPEGWARSRTGGTTTFTDKYNSVAIAVVPRSGRPTVASARRQDVPALRRSESKFAAGSVTTVQRNGGAAVLVTYEIDSAPNDVTGKVVRDAVERYEFWRDGEEAVLSLTGPQGADNVDPWRIVSDSLTWK